MASTFTAVIRQDGPWWIGWIEEVAGVNAQEHSREELLESLRQVLREALEFNRLDALEASGPGSEDGTYQESCPLGVLELNTFLKLTSI
jgi:hypothetical protein